MPYFLGTAQRNNFVLKVYKQDIFYSIVLEFAYVECLFRKFAMWPGITHAAMKITSNRYQTRMILRKSSKVSLKSLICDTQEVVFAVFKRRQSNLRYIFGLISLPPPIDLECCERPLKQFSNLTLLLSLLSREILLASGI